MLSCKEIVQLLNSEELFPLLKRMEMKMHLMMCKHCSTYSKHLQMLKNGFRKLFFKLTEVDPNDVKGIEEAVIEKINKSAPGK